jgi:hypothetical protein
MWFGLGLFVGLSVYRLVRLGVGSVSGSCAWLSRLFVSSSVDLASGGIGRFCLFVSKPLRSISATDVYILAITDSVQ